MISSSDSDPERTHEMADASVDTAMNDTAARTGSPRAARSSQTAGFPVFLVVQLVLTAAVFGYGTHRYQQIEAERLPPEPSMEPATIHAVRDVPEVVSDEQLVSVLNRLTPQFRGPEPKINFVDHALRFWGVEAVFGDENSLSGVELRELLTDHRRFRDAWGKKTRPFLLPNTEGDVPYLAFRTKSGLATASH
jgi:hypothetical protein